MKRGAADAEKRGKKEGMGKAIFAIVLLIVAGVVFFILKK
jgi:hypothetical protein